MYVEWKSTHTYLVAKSIWGSLHLHARRTKGESNIYIYIYISVALLKPCVAEEHLTRLLQLMHLRFGWSLRRPRITRSFFSSSFNLLAISTTTLPLSAPQTPNANRIITVTTTTIIKLAIRLRLKKITLEQVKFKSKFMHSKISKKQKK